MIPKRLKIEGLYSYQKAVEIDFEALLNARLFGIFGSVGSGKSALLEAMTYAIYGDTERLSHKGQGYNMMNLQSSRLFIEFDFEAAGKVFRSQTERKRNKKDFDTVTSPDRQAYVQKNGAWVPTEFAELKEAIGGLSYDNFRRTIIIPQGKFQEFLQLTPGQQSAMLKELFNLSQYDLGDAAAKLIKATQLDLTDNSGRLEELKSGSTHSLEQLQQLLEQANLERKEIGGQLKTVDEKMRTILLAKQRFEELAAKKVELDALKEVSVAIELRDLKLQRFERMRNLLGEKLNRYKKLEVELSSGVEGLKVLRDRYKTSKQAQEALQKRVVGLEKQLKESAQNEELKSSLTLRLEQLNREAEQSKLKTEAVEAKKESVTTEKKIKDLTVELEKVNKELEKVKQDFNNSENLLQVERWSIQRKTKVEQVITALNERDKLQARFSQQITQAKPAAFTGATIQDWLKQAEEEEKKAFTDYENYLQKTQPFAHASHLATLAQELKDGSPCPLCGSTDHPHHFHPAEVEKDWEKTLQSKQHHLDAAKKQRLQLEALRDQLTRQEKELKERETTLVTAQEEMKVFDANYPFTPIIPFAQLDLLPQKIAGRATLSAQLEKYEQKTLLSRSSLEAAQGSHQAVIQKTNELNVRLSKVSGQLDALYKNSLHDEVKALLTEEQVAQKLAMLTALEAISEAQVQTEKQNLTQAEQACAELIGVGNEKKEQQAKLQQELDSLSLEIDAVLVAEGWGQKRDAFVELSSGLDVNEERKQLRAFREKEAGLKSRIKELDELLKKEPYSNEKEAEELAKQADLKDKQSNLTATGAQLNLQLKQLEAEQKRRAELEKKIKLISARLDGLQNIGKLMRGNGFVNYVSSVYLREIVSAANLRFRKLTRQCLELEIDANNTFQIRDFLNGGKLRDARTLSGGQTFQASLCLALALAERIQTESGAKQQFFFLDEGFGSLDEESLQTVFETLKELRKENRVVGIISHVAALQQEIPAHLMVTRHEERGSEVELIA